MPPPEPGAKLASRAAGPHIVVLSSLFPSSIQPGAGLFIRERLFRVGRELPLCVVAPTPWFPLQGLIARFRPGFRPGAPRLEVQQGVDVWFPRFFSLPGLLKRLNAGMQMVASDEETRQPTMRRAKTSITNAT